MKDPDTGKRRSRPSSDDALVVHDVPELRIIDDALWLAVENRQKQMAQDTRPGHLSHDIKDGCGDLIPSRLKAYGNAGLLIT